MVARISSIIILLIIAVTSIFFFVVNFTVWFLTVFIDRRLGAAAADLFLGRFLHIHNSNVADTCFRAG